MSSLHSLTITNFRNLAHVEIEAHSHCNILFGLNGSGKTSFLEAIYYIGLGRSFRTRHTNRLIQFDQPNLTLHATLNHQQQRIPIGVERHTNGNTQLKINHDNAKSIAELAQLLPIQLIYPDGHKLLLGGSKSRRQFLDWGVFHVEHAFLNYWQRAQRAIKNRNLLLKQSRPDKNEIAAWDHEIIASTGPIDEYRSSYVGNILPIFEDILSILLPDLRIELTYYPGWNPDKDYQIVLKEQFQRDRLLSYTQSGPHKADLIITNRNRPLAEILSQGQQKLVNFALKLAQGMLLNQARQKQSIYLIDDLPAELDQYKRQLLTSILRGMNAQIFITGIDCNQTSSIADNFSNPSMFHVEHGNISHALHKFTVSA